MKIFNIRLGHANNSSSSHSLIFYQGAQDTWDGSYSFQWNDFTLATKESKTAYLAAMIYENTYDLEDDLRYKLIEDLTGVRLSDIYPDNERYYSSISIDHQSIMRLPLRYNSKELHLGFIEALRDYLSQDGLVILGGNDNSDPHPLLNDHERITYPIDIRGGSYEHDIARYDPVYDCWTLYSPYSGAKLRFSFHDNTSKPEKLSTPELVDLKITDYCPFDCAFCYQGSTRSGVHAPKQVWERALQALSKLEVFEVAIGGGEPTLHPDFHEIVRYCKSVGITPNFTTKNIGWFKNRNKETLDLCGGFAYSVETEDNIHNLVEKLNGMYQEENRNRSYSKPYYAYNNKVTIQVIDGVVSEVELKDILDACSEYHFRLIILGYKTNNRGQEYSSQKTVTNWLKVVQEARKDRYRWMSVSIDTALASQYQEDLKKANIPHVLYFSEEGKFSMYLDLVSMKAGASSYHEDTFTSLRDLDQESILHAFSQW